LSHARVMLINWPSQMNIGWAYGLHTWSLVERLENRQKSVHVSVYSWLHVFKERNWQTVKGRERTIACTSVCLLQNPSGTHFWCLVYCITSYSKWY